MTCVPVLQLDSVDSTLLEAERQASAGRTGPLVICAREQTGGLGRHGRVWASPPGNLYWTMLLDTAADRPRDAGLAFAAGLAVRDALIGLDVPADRLQLKWPNDVLLDGAKLAGVLARSSQTGAACHTVVGIGINVATAPETAAFPAIALATTDLAVPPLAILRVALTTAFLARRAQWHRDGLAPLRDTVAACLFGVGTTTRIARDRDRRDLLIGTNEGLDQTGALLLRTPDGVQHVVIAGDILA